MKTYFLGIVILGLFVTGLNVNADEVGPNTCGQSIYLKGNINHYKNESNYTVANATESAFYAEEVYGLDFTVTIPNLTKGVYKLEVFTAESYHTTANQRVFNITHNNETIAENLDIFAEVGKDTEFRLVHNLHHNTNTLEINFKAQKDHAKFNAIRLFNQHDSIVACVKASELQKIMEDPETGNPLVWHMFTADPSAHVFDNRMYVYPSHDQNNAAGFNMIDYHVFSSDDLLNWTDHGVALHVNDVPWAKEYMWAPDCAYKNEIYYFYFPAKDHAGEFKIGVATSKSPTGPFTPEPEAIKGSFSVDPSVFIDDDGQAYMYFGGAGDGGQTTAWVAKLDSTMKQFDGEPKPLSGLNYWFEACWMQKHNDTYYMSYSMGTFNPQYKNSSTIGYATSKNPMGPFQYQGLLNGYVSGWTNHHSTVNYKGQSYFFYHTSDLSEGNTTKRSIAAEYMHFKNDGSIAQINQTEQGIGSYNGTKRIQAENYHASIGAKKTDCSEGGFSVLFNANDTLAFNNIEFGNEEMSYIQLRIETSITGTVEILSDNNSQIGTIKIENITENEIWKTIEAPINNITGTQNIRLVYKTSKNERLNLDWIEFSDTTTTSVREIKKSKQFKVYPNPYEKGDINLYFTNQIENFQLDILSSTGQNIFTHWYSQPQRHLVLTNLNLPKGISVIRVTSNNKNYNSKIEVI